MGGPWQNLSVVLGLEATNGYNPLRIGIYDKYVSPGEATFAINQRHFPPTFSGYDSALARAMGLEYVVLDRPIEQFQQLRRPERVQTLMAGPTVWIYRLAAAEPRVRFSSRVQVADVDLTLTNGDLRNPPAPDRVTIDDETPLLRPRSIAMAGPAGTARISKWQPGRIAVDVQARSAGVLILHDVYYPGWIAEVDGIRTQIHRADVMFRAVEVPAGRHRVTFRFAPLALDNLVAAVRQLSKPPMLPPALSPLPNRSPSLNEDLIASARRSSYGRGQSARQAAPPLP